MSGSLLKYNGNLLKTPTGAYGIKNLVPENVKSGVNIGGVVGTAPGPSEPVTGQKILYSASNTLKITGLTKEPSTIILMRNPINSTNLSFIVRPDKNTDPLYGYSGYVTNNSGWIDISYSDGTLTIVTGTSAKFNGTYNYWLI